MKYAIIENNQVVNIARSSAPLADNWVVSEVASIGDRYENGQFIKPELTPELTPEPTKEELLAQLQALQTQIQALEQ